MAAVVENKEGAQAEKEEAEEEPLSTAITNNDTARDIHSAIQAPIAAWIRLRAAGVSVSAATGSSSGGGGGSSSVVDLQQEGGGGGAAAAADDDDDDSDNNVDDESSLHCSTHTLYYYDFPSNRPLQASR
jgi:hypothetical protein